MKTNRWILSALAALGAVSVMAQTNTPAPTPTAPAPAAAATVDAPAPTASEAPAKPVRPKARKMKMTPIDPPEAAVVNEDVLNVRGQPNFTGEVITHLKKGDIVTVDQEITLTSHEKAEPAKWARIGLPANITVWVDAQFVGH